MPTAKVTPIRQRDFLTTRFHFSNRQFAALRLFDENYRLSVHRALLLDQRSFGSLFASECIQYSTDAHGAGWFTLTPKGKAAKEAFNSTDITRKSAAEEFSKHYFKAAKALRNFHRRSA